MTESAEDVRARVRAKLDHIRRELPENVHEASEALDVIEKALDEPKPTLRERVAEVIRSSDSDLESEEVADAVLACIAEGADDRLGKTPASILSDGNRRNIIAAVLEVDPEQVT